MIDRVARTQLSERLRSLAAGLITNDAFEDSLPQSPDAAIEEIADEAMYLYSDLWPHRLTGPHRLPREAKRDVARWIVFLASDGEYQWPPWPFFSVFAGNLFTFGIASRRIRARWASHGDISVWPFLSEPDYLRAIQSPSFLTGRGTAPLATA